MKYELQDIPNLPLREDLARLLREELHKLKGFITPQAVPANITPDFIKADVKSMLYDAFQLEDYQNTLEYQLAESNVERANIALNAKMVDKSKGKILELWLKYADQMTDFEKIMAGWDKV